MVGAAGEDGDGAYAGFPGSLDVPHRVTGGDGLLSSRPGSPQGLLEDVGGRFRVLDGTGVDDTIHAVFSFELSHVMSQLLIFGAVSQPAFVALFFRPRDPFLRPRKRMTILLQLPVE